MSDLKPFLLHTAFLDNAIEINQRLINGLNTYIDQETTRKTHHFHGRYENIYIEKEQVPAIAEVLEAAKNFAAKILGMQAKDLKAGLWFNLMEPGNKTTLHRHDDDDELLSCVYYVKVAENSGTLHIGTQPIFAQVTATEGMFAFFPPNMPHEVSENLSDQSRISLGINIGPKETIDD